MKIMSATAAIVFALINSAIAETGPNLDSFLDSLTPKGRTILRRLEANIAAIQKPELPAEKRRSLTNSTKMDLKLLASSGGDLSRPLVAGTIGRMPIVEIRQVIDDAAFLAELRFTYTAKPWPVALVKGLSTEGLTDGSKAEFNVPVYVAGTQTYETAIGTSNTVYLLRSFDTDALEQALLDRAEAKKKAKSKKKTKI